VHPFQDLKVGTGFFCWQVFVEEEEEEEEEEAAI
jgi:hypothetical protein